MNYIILDLEWNQSSNGSCNDLTFEIIEIGAVKYNEDFKKIGTYQKLIKPSVYKRIHPIISNITGINERMLSYEKPFTYVIKEFLRWCGEDYIFCTFGNQDLMELQSNMAYHKIEIPWKYPFKYIDVQRVFAMEHPETNEVKSLEALVEYYKIKQKNIYHRALGDALYTGEVMKMLDRENIEKYMALDYFNLPVNTRKEKEINLGSHLEYVSKLYDDKEELIKNKKIYITKCLICGKKCRKKIKWFSDNSKYLCLAKCENHGLIEGSIVFRKKNFNKKEEHYAIRRVKMVGDEGENYVKERKNTVIEKRRNRRLNSKDKQKNSIEE